MRKFLLKTISWAVKSNGLQLATNKSIASDTSLTYNKDELLILIKESTVLTAWEKDEFEKLFNSDEDLWKTGETLYKILSDERKLILGNQQTFKKAIENTCEDGKEP